MAGLETTLKDTGNGVDALFQMITGERTADSLPIFALRTRIIIHQKILKDYFYENYHLFKITNVLFKSIITTVFSTIRIFRSKFTVPFRKRVLVNCCNSSVTVVRHTSKTTFAMRTTMRHSLKPYIANLPVNAVCEHDEFATRVYRLHQMHASYMDIIVTWTQFAGYATFQLARYKGLVLEWHTRLSPWNATRMILHFKLPQTVCKASNHVRREELQRWWQVEHNKISMHAAYNQR